MPSGRNLYPQFGLRIPEITMDKLKFIAAASGRSATKEIEQLILRHIADYEKVYGTVELQPDDYEYIRKRTIPAEES